MKVRVLLAVAVAFGLLALSVAIALGEDAAAPVRVQAVDSFPVALGYAFLGAVGTGYTVLAGVITKLWLDGKDAAKKLNEEKDSRRVEAEKLLREHTTLLREVLSATNAKKAAYDSLASAVAAQTEAVQDLMRLVGQK